ncbi:Procathepsin L [Manis javanica]|nr:Procathepsin L [Manis javanica]
MIDQQSQEYRQGNHSFTMAMNAFGDVTKEEIRQVRNGLQEQKHKTGKVFPVPTPTPPSPPSGDWREKGYVTPVNNQGHCASGCAFSATVALEGMMLSKTDLMPAVHWLSLTPVLYGAKYDKPYTDEVLLDIIPEFLTVTVLCWPVVYSPLLLRNRIPAPRPHVIFGFFLFCHPSQPSEPVQASAIGWSNHEVGDCNPADPLVGSRVFDRSVFDQQSRT